LDCEYVGLLVFYERTSLRFCNKLSELETDDDVFQSC
jgi:hypothetical protein